MGIDAFKELYEKVPTTLNDGRTVFLEQSENLFDEESDEFTHLRDESHQSV